MFEPKPLSSMEDYKLERLDIHLLSVSKEDYSFLDPEVQFQKDLLSIIPSLPSPPITLTSGGDFWGIS